MTKDEFLHRLRAALYLSVSDHIIDQQINYYNKFILEGVSMGRTEEDVVESLGDPRLLAKSIIDAAEAGGDEVANDTPFRYSESEINYAPDEEDAQYSGTASDSGKSEDTVHVQNQYSEHDDGRRADESGDTNRGYSGGYRGNVGNNPFGHVYSTSGVGCLIFIFVLFLILWLVGSVIGGIFALLSPVLAPLMVIFVILWIIKGMMDK